MVNNNPTTTNGHAANGTSSDGLGLDSLHLENLLLRDEDIFQTSLNSEDYLESLAPIIKEAIKVNGLSNLIVKLNEIVKQKDEELNQASMESADEINTCINNIDNIFKEANDLNGQLVDVDQKLSKSAVELMQRKKNYVKYKNVSGRINETQVVLNECIQVLELTNKILELIRQTKYFSALKLIDELTSIHLLKVEDFTFAKKIEDSIPHLTKMVKEDSFENLSKWLSLNLERKLLAIGERIFDNLHKLQKNWEETKENNRTFLPYKLNSPVEISLRDPATNYNIFQDETLQIPLNSIYDAILVYQTLHESESLVSAYHKEWMKKYNRIIYPLTPASVSKKEVILNNRELGEYLRKITAFFIMDKQLNLITKFQLRTNNQADELWISYVSKLKSLLIYNLKRNQFDNIESLNEFKNLIGDFLQVMDNYSYDVSDLYQVMMLMFKDYFAPLMVQEFRSEFIESITSDHYMPLSVDSMTDYENIMKIVWYKKDAPFAPENVTKAPVTFPFSEDYVHYCYGIRTLLTDVLTFLSEHYNYEITEINEIIVHNIIELVLSDKKGSGIVYDIEDFVKKNINNKEIVVQTYTNLEYYLFSLYEVGRMVNRKLRQYTGMGIHNIDTNDTFTLQAVERFKNLRKYSEETIFKMVDTKINELLDMVEYTDYITLEKNSEANYSVKDFALFLENMFTSIFSNLPSTFRTLGLFKTYDHVSVHFLNVLKGAPYFNRTFIDNFDLDIKYLEESMKNNLQDATMSKDGNTMALESTFTELRQCIDLLKLENYDEFVTNSTFRMRNFDRIKLEDGISLISKVKDTQVDHRRLASGGSAGLFDSTSMNSPSTASGSETSSTASKLAQFKTRFKKRSED
ncbi:SEC15 [[Candida] subhashii]|uniref:Exocyst complex component SEC15 n=1 Tax=[Candida] subhashii TaxID=561895 RepID=A0A8J5QQ19_9ASCO|nr:SEC15 [[Candida] subhashii]KAG7664515.1 SEC15 [[Candida] subhashii]